MRRMACCTDLSRCTGLVFIGAVLAEFELGLDALYVDINTHDIAQLPL